MTPIDLTNAFEFMAEVHAGQFRKEPGPSGVVLPYAPHPSEVLKQLWFWGTIDYSMAVAALLHDVVEDCGVLPAEIEEEFGVEVVDLVVELTHDKEKETKEEYLTGFKRKSHRALIIKLADRFCNVKDFNLTNPDYAHKYAAKAGPVYREFYARKSGLLELFPEEALNQVALDVAWLMQMG